MHQSSANLCATEGSDGEILNLRLLRPSPNPAEDERGDTRHDAGHEDRPTVDGESHGIAKCPTHGRPETSHERSSAVTLQEQVENHEPDRDAAFAMEDAAAQQRPATIAVAVERD
jgi:hypothetical protein